MPNGIAKLERDHQEVARSLTRFVEFVDSSDHVQAREEWDGLEAQILTRLDAEEMFLLPGFERDQPTGAAAIRNGHARIRALLGEIGIAIDLNCLRTEKVSELRDLLASHAEEEAQSLYGWAQANADHEPSRALLRRLEPTTPRDSAALALAEIVRVCEDGERGYRAAGYGVAKPGYQLLFARYAAERARFARTIDEAVRMVGLDSPDEGSVLGSLHRGWLNAVSIIARGSPKTVLRQCQRGEDAALKTYRAALRAELPADVREVIQEQYEAIKKARAEIASLANAEGS
jgi:uncharacterized protein (TIGR02284 family)